MGQVCSSNTFFTHTHAFPHPQHTHTPAKQSLANAPRLAQPLPLPKMLAILHQRMLERVGIACSNFSCKIFTLEIRGSQTLEETQRATQVKLA